MTTASEVRRAKLSNTTAKTALPSGVDDLVVKDTLLTGFQLRVRKASRRWLFSGKVKGGPRRTVTIGDCAAMTADQARVLATQARLDFMAGVDPVAEAQAHKAAVAAAVPPPARPSFAGVAALYYEDWRQGNLGRGRPRPASIPSFRSNVARAIAFFGDKPIDTITPLDVRAFKASLASSKDIKAGTASKDLTITKLVFRYAVEPAALIETSPALEVQGLRGSKMRERVLTADEIKAVWNATPALGRQGQLVRFLMCVPLRLSMARLATWDQIDLDAKTISIPADAPGNKAAKAMVLPLNDLAVEVLETMPFRKGVVFPGIHGAAVGFGTDEKTKLDRLSGVSDWRLHDMRRTCATQTANNHESVDIDAFESLLQHTRSGIMGVYQQSSRMKAMRVCAQQWEVTLRGFVGMEPPTSNVVPLIAKWHAA